VSFWPDQISAASPNHFCINLPTFALEWSIATKPMSYYASGL
jgi:hypothetical protein